MRRRVAILLMMGLLAPSFIETSSAVTSYPGSVKVLKVASFEKDYPLRTVYVWTPPDVDTDTSTLPVVYFLHGWPGTPEGMMSGTIPALVSAFNKGARKFIAVFPDGNATTHSDSEWADSYDKKAMVATWLTTSVIKTVEAGHIRSRNNRAILGFSMGGYGAAILGLQHPDLYSQVISLAGYFVVDDLTNAYGTPPGNAKRLAAQNPNSYLKIANRIHWYLGESSEDYTLLIRGQADQWAKKLGTVNVKATIDKARGGHSYTFVSAEIVPVTKWLSWSAT